MFSKIKSFFTNKKELMTSPIANPQDALVKRMIESKKWLDVLQILENGYILKNFLLIDLFKNVQEKDENSLLLINFIKNNKNYEAIFSELKLTVCEMLIPGNLILKKESSKDRFFYNELFIVSKKYDIKEVENSREDEWVSKYNASKLNATTLNNFDLITAQSILESIGENIFKNDLNQLLNLTASVKNWKVQIKKYKQDVNIKGSTLVFSKDLDNFLNESLLILDNLYEKNKNQEEIKFDGKITSKNIQSLPSKAKELCNSIENQYEKAKQNNLDDEERFQFNKLYEERLPQVLKSFFSVDEQYRDIVKDKDGNTSIDLLITSLEEINDFFAFKISEQKVEDTQNVMSEMRIQKRYLKGFKNN